MLYSDDKGKRCCTRGKKRKKRKRKKKRERVAKRELLRERRQPRKRAMHGEENIKERAKYCRL